MHWSQFFIPTSKETPKDATAASHVLMLRAGLIRQVAAGVYCYLPLGYRTLRKVEAIVREEMNRAGAIELHMSVLMPLEWWQQTGRTDAMGETLLRLGGPPGDWRSQTVLGPTHEEQVVDIARAFLGSYKQLPINLYQIQTKFRGEARPKSGVLRTREFLMKDAYSFHADKTSLDEGYQKMYDAYCRIFGRCGLPYVAVEADSGPIGGDSSHEFMVLTDAGEDTVAISENGDYAANTERATAFFEARGHDATKGRSPESSPAAAEPLREVHTPGAGRVEDVCKVLGTTPAQMIKTLIYTVTQPGPEGQARGAASGPQAPPRGSSAPASRLVALVRGDHDVNEIKLCKAARQLCGAANASIEMADARTIEELTGAKVGFAGPQGIVERFRAGDLLVIDREVTVMCNAASGANKTDYHVTGVNPGRDFPLAPDDRRPHVLVADIRMVVDGDLSPRGSGSPIRLKTAIEVGHVFKLGTKYSDAMHATFLTREGKPARFIMGCYGIGLNRIVAAAIEANHDDNGIIWPMSIAPFEAVVVALDPRDDHAMGVAAGIYGELTAAGVDVLFDDRDERAGFKFKDADLVGVPLRVVVGKKSLAEGVVEWSHRKEQVKHTLPPAQAAQHIAALVREARGS
jgi:prolyl-tRNA synthetase